MKLCQLDPYVRFAAGVHSGGTEAPVKVTDCRIFYVEEGRADITFEDTVHDLPKGSLFYCPGGSIYRLSARSGLRLVCINFDLTREHEAHTLPFPVCPRPEQWSTIPVFRDTVEDSTFLNSYHLIKDASQWHESILELTRQFGENTGIHSLLCGSLLKTLLLRMHLRKQTELPAKLRLVLDYIHTNYHSPISNKQLGALTGYHEYYLNRMFRSYVGMNLHNYLIKVRMEQAAYLILNTQLPLNTIAEEVGIRSYPHFSACFKQFYGCSPAHFNAERK